MAVTPKVLCISEDHLPSGGSMGKEKKHETEMVSNPPSWPWQERATTTANNTHVVVCGCAGNCTLLPAVCFTPLAVVRRGIADMWHVGRVSPHLSFSILVCLLEPGEELYYPEWVRKTVKFTAFQDHFCPTAQASFLHNKTEELNIRSIPRAK